MAPVTSVGTHNLHDETGTATAFAHVLMFTEAIAPEVLKDLPEHYVVSTCKWQKDLIIAWDPTYFRPERDSQDRIKARYRLNNTGIAGVSPHRGTYWIKGEILVRGKWIKTVLMVSHWVNAAFPPYIRGEGRWRRRVWRRIQKFTLKLIRRLRGQGYQIIGAGDVNTPYGKNALRDNMKINEVGHHFDRIWSTFELKKVKYYSKKGSDHPRLYAELGLAA